MKRLVSLFTAALLAVSALAGCSQGTSSGGNESASASSGDASISSSASAADGAPQVITLKIAHNMDFVTIPDSVIEAGSRLNEKYAAEGKNMKIEFEEDYQRIDWTEYHNNVVFAEKSGDGPDMFSLDSDIYGFVNAGMLLDISDVKSDAFVDGIFNPFTIDGKIYGMPFDLPVRVMYYNKTALSKIGWSDEDIKALPGKISDGSFKFEDFMALAAEVQQKGAAQYGLTHRPGAGSDFLDIFQTLGGKYYDEQGKLVFDEVPMTRFFQSIYDNANVSKLTPNNLNQVGWDTINKMVGDGTAFSYYGPIYSSTYVAKAAEKTPEQFVEDVEFVLFPASQYNEKPFVVAAPQGMGISASTKYPDVCKDLLKELAADSSDLLANHASTIFTLSSVKAANDTDAIKNNPILKEVGYMADFAVTPPTIEGLSTFTTELHKQIVQLELGQIQPEQAVADMKTQIELNLDPENVVFQ